MVVFDEAGPVSSLLLTQRHLHSARVGETFQTKHWTQHQSDCLSSWLADWLYLRIWWRGESRGDTLVRTLSIVSGDTQTGAQRLNHSLLSLSPAPGGLDTSSPPHNTTLLASKFIIFHFNIFPCGARCVCSWEWSCYCLSELLVALGLETLILLTVIFDVRRNVTSFKTSNFEYFNIFENKILII